MRAAIQSEIGMATGHPTVTATAVKYTVTLSIAHNVLLNASLQDPFHSELEGVGKVPIRSEYTGQCGMK